MQCTPGTVAFLRVDFVEAGKSCPPPIPGLQPTKRLLGAPPTECPPRFGMRYHDIQNCCSRQIAGQKKVDMFNILTFYLINRYDDLSDSAFAPRVAINM